MTDQVFALAGLLVAVAVCAVAIGFALGRLTGSRRRFSGREAQSERVLASALEDGLARLKAQQRAMSDRAEASERLSAQIVHNLTAGLLLVDGEGLIELLNPAGQRFLGLTVDAIGSHYLNALERAPTLTDLVSASLRSREPVTSRTVRVLVDERTLHFGVTLSPVELGGTSTGVICLFSDLTRVVEMEDQLRLRDALARLGELTAGLAHEFRNGLATIHGYGRLLDPAALPQPYASYVESLRAETDQLGRVVTNFLGFAKPESLTFARVAVGAVVRRAVDELRQDVPDDAEILVEGQFGEVDGDEQLLKQALDNLLRNAVAACAGVGRAPRVVIAGAIDASEGVCRVFVDDNGPGIPAVDRERVFRPFFTTRSAGTGLGLAIVQKIVLAHDGTIAAATSPAGGARLHLSLPLLRPGHHAQQNSQVA